MARQPPYCRSSRLCSYQQGLESGRTGLSPHPCRSATSQAATLARCSDQATRACGRHAPRGEGVKHAILVVEDNPLNRELLCDWLETEGYEVSSAETLSSAIASIEQRPPDAVLLDVQLGDDDGLSLAAWMRKQPKLCHIPVIAVTAHALVTEQRSFLQAGCNACVSKPINFKVLREELERWLKDPRVPQVNS